MQHWGAGIRSLSALATPIARQTIFLWGIDMVSNLLDFIYHFYLGRTLSPGDFAAIQTANSALLIVLTAFGVLQPAVARFTAEEDSQGATDQSAGIFRQFFAFALIMGLVLGTVLWILREPVSDALNIPILVVAASSAVILFSLQRPVVLGVFQGLQRFIAFGLLRGIQALSRLIAGIVLISLGWGLFGATVALPLGQAALIICGLALLGRGVWKRKQIAEEHSLAAGLRLSLAALIAYAAFMSLLNIDLVWVNRSFEPGIAAEYATAVLLRRSLILFPGAVLVVAYPRIIKRIESRLLPDPILWKASAAIAGAIILVTFLYVLYGDRIIDLTFGVQYRQAVDLILPMAVGVLGFSLGSLWLNLYLATRPLPFVTFMAAVAGFQAVLFANYHARVDQIILIYSLTGWLVFAIGLAFYHFWLRPGLSREFAAIGGRFDKSS